MPQLSILSVHLLGTVFLCEENKQVLQFKLTGFKFKTCFNFYNFIQIITFVLVFLNEAGVHLTNKINILHRNAQVNQIIVRLFLH